MAAGITGKTWKMSDMANVLATGKGRHVRIDPSLDRVARVGRKLALTQARCEIRSILFLAD